MKISRHWLQKFFDTELPPADKLAEAITFHAFEIEGVEKVEGDEILDIKVTPNRGHDGLSHRAIAKELSAILDIPLTHDPFGEVPVLAPVTDAVSVSITEAALCPRYIAGFIRGVKVGASPKWLQERLEAIGQRPINNVVDATNFVMFNLGQPLHAFDAGKLGSTQIGVRLAKSGEEMEALDKKKYTLSGSMLVITAGDLPVGIAGVKGGSPAAIDEATKDIVIESANFDGVSIRKTAQALKLRTDASQRFEQAISGELAAYGIKAVAEMIVEHAGGELLGFVDVYPTQQEKRTVSTSTGAVAKILGVALGNSEIAGVFTRLGFPFEQKEEVFEVAVPFERLDIQIPEDLAEEVARITGYEKIPAVSLSPSPKKSEINKNFYTAERVREGLVAQGYSEVYTSVFSDKGERLVANKVDSVKPYLRANLTDGLQEALKKNLPNKDLLGLSEIKLFEIGPIWKGGVEVWMIGAVSEKEKASEKLLKPVEAEMYENLPLSVVARFQLFSRFPYIVRDIALWIPQGINMSSTELADSIWKEAGSLCTQVMFFDSFERQGKKSFAFRLIFQSFEKTLEDKEVNIIMEKVSKTLRQQDFEIR